MRRFSRGFTLVELLVVIGIIALLISILLPSLSAARRQANAVKCATQLRELGNAFRFYAQDNKNYYPPAIINGTQGTFAYEIDGVSYPQTLPNGTRTYGAYWFNFINKYVSKTVLGSGTASKANSADARKTVVWGCPEFDGYNQTGLGTAADVNPVQPGYGMNFTPYWTAEMTTYPSPPAVPATDPAYNPYQWLAYAPSATPALMAANRVGFHKATFWNRNGAMRMLLEDNALYLADAGPPVTTGTAPNLVGVVGPFSGDQNVTRPDYGAYTSVWRHGKHPTTGQMLTDHANSGWYVSGNNGKVQFNVLYCDGHVVTESDAKIAYSGQRMKFPG